MIISVYLVYLFRFSRSTYTKGNYSFIKPLRPLKTKWYSGYLCVINRAITFINLIHTGCLPDCNDNITYLVFSTRRKQGNLPIDRVINGSRKYPVYSFVYC